MIIKRNRWIKTFAVLISVVICFFLLALSGLIAYQEAKDEALLQLHIANETIQSRFEQSINHADNHLDKLLLSHHSCSRQELEQRVANSPHLSILFSQTNNKLCSNLSNLALPVSIQKKPYLNLQGPIKLKWIEEPVYLISIKKNNTFVGAFYTKTVLKDALMPESHPQMQSLLYLMTPIPHVILSAHNKLSTPYLDKKSNRFQIQSHLPLIKDAVILNRLPRVWVFDKIKHHLLLLVIIAIFISLLAVYSIFKFTQKRLSLVYHLKQAAKNDEFIPYYQPVMDLSREIITGVECLIRWKTPNDQLISPVDFIDTLITLPLIDPVTTRLMEKIFADLGSYCHLNPNFHIAINLTPRHFDSLALLNHAIKLCKRYKVKHHQVIFELTEQHLIDKQNITAIKHMRAMQHRGFKIALDDFGTGFANINYLQRFAFDILKIDRQFVIAIGTGAMTEKIADSIVIIAKSLNMKVVAEGVDSELHARHLRALGVEYAQGFYYAKPMPLNKLKQTFLNERLAHQQTH